MKLTRGHEAVERKCQGYVNPDYEVVVQRIASLETTVVHLDKLITESKQVRGSDFTELKEAYRIQLSSINNLELTIVKEINKQNAELRGIIDKHDKDLKEFIKEHYVSKSSLRGMINGLMFKFCLWLTGIFATGLSLAYALFYG